MELIVIAGLVLHLILLMTRPLPRLLLRLITHHSRYCQSVVLQSQQHCVGAILLLVGAGRNLLDLSHLSGAFISAGSHIRIVRLVSLSI